MLFNKEKSIGISEDFFLLIQHGDQIVIRKPDQVITWERCSSLKGKSRQNFLFKNGNRLGPRMSFFLVWEWPWSRKIDRVMTGSMPGHSCASWASTQLKNQTIFKYNSQNN